MKAKEVRELSDDALFQKGAAGGPGQEQVQVAAGVGIEAGVGLDDARPAGQHRLDPGGADPRRQIGALPVGFRDDAGQVIDEAVPQAGLDRFGPGLKDRISHRRCPFPAGEARAQAPATRSESNSCSPPAEWSLACSM